MIEVEKILSPTLSAKIFLLEKELRILKEKYAKSLSDRAILHTQLSIEKRKIKKSETTVLMILPK